MLARISDDAFGVRLRERLVGDGVDVRYVVKAAEQLRRWQAVAKWVEMAGEAMASAE